VFIIEINDNPNIDAGVEDKVLKGGLYAKIMGEFIRRIEASRSP
jgi:glutathione synthase/RimK-type ligase-like ATP-grasp enzyme